MVESPSSGQGLMLFFSRIGVAEDRKGSLRSLCSLAADLRVLLRQKRIAAKDRKDRKENR